MKILKIKKVDADSYLKGNEEFYRFSSEINSDIKKVAAKINNVLRSGKFEGEFRRDLAIKRNKLWILAT